jgi:Fur family ferric uptake transcriptional regulator
MDLLQTKSLEYKASSVLRRMHLNITDSMKKILSLFLIKKYALAHADIEKKAGEKFDRVTVYRTLQTFVEKGIVHTIPTADNAILYALCKDCDEEHHHDDHVHFVCSNCNATICLDDVVSPEIKLPQGYVAENVQVVINGICKRCNTKNNNLNF